MYLRAAFEAAKADVIFESGTLGPTGVTWADLLSSNVPGSNVSSNVFDGVRFQLTQPVSTSQIGGHFAAPNIGTFFGAIVKLADENDFPDSGNLSTPDVLGHTLLAFPSPSAEVFGNLNLHLDPGWYALVFGSGLFGTSAADGTVQNGADIGNPSYIAFEPGFGWGSSSNPIFRNYRFVVDGQIVPEPSSIILVPIALVCLKLVSTEVA